MTIRDCQPSDYRDIHRLNRQSLGYDFPLEQTRAQLAAILSRGRDRLFVACLEGRVGGYIHGSDYHCTYAHSIKNIMAIAVEPDCQGRGAGRALLDAVEAWAREDGCSGVRLVSGMERTGAHQFYLRCGYALRKEQKNFFKRLTP